MVYKLCGGNNLWCLVHAKYRSGTIIFINLNGFFDMFSEHEYH